MIPCSVLEASCQRCAVKMRILHVAEPKMEVRISGCVFASLFIELANSKGDIEGFLIGEILDRTTNIVSDSQDVTVKRQRNFAVQEILVCRGIFSFYDGVGRIHPDKIDSILGDKKQAVLGWFKFRRNSKLRVSMREKAVHKNLQQQLKIKLSQNFIFSLFTLSHESNFATHTFEYSASYCLQDSRVFSDVPVAIVNLGNTAQTEYKQHIEPTRSTSKHYQNIIGSFRDEFLDNVGQLQQVKHARSMYKNMLGRLSDLAETVHSSESELQVISDQVESLREELEKTIHDKRMKGKQELILLDEPEAQKDLINFDEPPAEKIVVVAKHIFTGTTQSNNVSHKPFSARDSGSRKAETMVKCDQVHNNEPVEHHEYETASDSQLY